MIFIAFGRWSNAAGSWFFRERIWWRGYRWTPFVRIRWRYEFAMHVAYALPRCVVNWALIRAWAHATGGQWANEDATSVTMSEAVKRWEQEATLTATADTNTWESLGRSIINYPEPSQAYGADE